MNLQMGEKEVNLTFLNILLTSTVIDSFYEVKFSVKLLGGFSLGTGALLNN